MTFLIKLTDLLNLWATRFSKLILAAVFIIMAVAVFSQIVLRTFGHSFIAMEDVAIFGFFWLVFLGMAIAFHDRIHVKVEFFVKLFPSKVQKIIYIISNLVVLVFMFFFTWSGVMMTVNNVMQRAMQIGISMAYVYVIMPVAGFFAFVIVLNYFLRRLKGLDPNHFQSGNKANQE